jgi:hypothetical protein
MVLIFVFYQLLLFSKVTRVMTSVIDGGLWWKAKNPPF